jgi:hypothetical protein
MLSQVPHTIGPWLKRVLLLELRDPSERRIWCVKLLLHALLIFTLQLFEYEMSLCGLMCSMIGH